MKWLFYKKGTDEKAKINLVYSIKPDNSMLNDNDYIFIEDDIKPKNNGEIPILYCNTKTKDVWYEYEEKLKTKEDMQEENMESLAQTIAKLNLENKKKDIIATTLAQTVATLNLRVNKLEKEKEGR